MSLSTWELPSSIGQNCKEYFGPIMTQKALKLFRLSKVSISFKKGTPETYYICSGIIRDNRSHEGKIVFKKRLIGSDEGPLSSNCDCNEWSKEKHCSHTASLFMAYHVQRMAEGDYEGNTDSMPPIPVNSSFGVNVTEYGTILNGPHQLQGAHSAPTYSSLQYLLHNKKIVNFPLPENFVGKLIIKVNSNKKFFEDSMEYKSIPVIKFAHLSPEGKITKEISMFENLYMFDWKTGHASNLNTEIREIVQKIRIKGSRLSINDLIKVCYTEKSKDFIDFYIDDTKFEEIEKEEVGLRVSLLSGAKKSTVNFQLQFFDSKNISIEPPMFLKVFTFQGGSLSSFKKKSDAYNFLKEMVLSLENNDDNYKKFLAGISKRDSFTKQIDHCKSRNFSLSYDPNTKMLHSFDNHFLIKLLCNFFNNFGELFFRYSEANNDEKEINYQLSPSTLFRGLSNFHRDVTPYGVNIFYNKNEISKWSSRIRFERKKTTTSWFDLELNVSKEDLEIIKNADLDNGLALTDQGLILLSEDQKNLARLMKRYTQYEGKEVQSAEKKLDELSDDDFKTFSLPFNRARIFELFELKKLGIDGALTEDEEKLCKNLMTLESVPEYDLPENLKEIARPYQVTGYNWLRFLHENQLGACLADDMGLGKTLQSITFIKSVYHDLKKVLIVCPVSLLLNWEKEFEKFSDIPIHIYHGGTRELPEDSKIILTSYGIMKKEIDQSFADQEFDVLILDEVQHLKNIRSQGAFAARKINAKFRICLTGTPVENDLAEFYNILDLSIPGIWGDLQFIRTTSTKKSRLLARKTASPFILRRTKSQVLTDLPPKIENNVFLSLSEVEQTKYENTLKNIKSRIENSPSKKKYGEILKGLLELRQSCLWQADNKKVKNIDEIDSTKINFLIETLEQILEEGHQAIIFSQFTTYLDIIQNAFDKRCWKYSRIDGSQHVKKRQKQVDEFQEGKNPLFLISLKAGGVGLNLTAASYVFVMDPWWNPAVEAQAIDRAHRIGQKNTLNVYRPIIKDSVEEKVLKLQEMKKELFMDLLSDNDGQFTGKLTMRDFEQLFT